MGTEKAFDKQMGGVDWERVYERQAARGDLTTRFCELLGIQTGDSILELGSGPGYMTGQLAHKVAPGTVYAIDRQGDALRYLQATNAQETACIQPVCGDVTALPLSFSDPIPTIAAFLLHHLVEPRIAIDAIASILPPDSPLLIAEYHPEAAGDVGPPLDHRIAPERVAEWLKSSGFTTGEPIPLPEEKYALLSRR